MANADGSVIIKTDLDDKQAQAELNRLTKKIDTLNNKISDKRQEQMPLVEQSKQIAANLDAAKVRLDQMRSGDEFVTSASMQQQEQTVTALQKDFDSVQKKIEMMDASIQKGTRNLERMKVSAGDFAAQISGANKEAGALADAGERVDEYMDNFFRRVKGLAKRVFVFGLITQGFRGIRDWLGKTLKANSQVTAAIARLKGALLTLAQPLVTILIPAATTFINLLTQLVTVLAKVSATIFGTTIDQAKEAAKNLYDESEALDSTGDSAKKAGKSLASFDEINRLGDENKTEVQPDFSSVGEDNWLKQMLGSAADMVSEALILAGIAFIAIGAAMGSIKMVITGLMLIGAGLFVAEETGALQSWVDTLGLNSVSEFVVIAVILAGIAMVAIGAAMGNILLVVAGLVLIGIAVIYAKNSGMLQDWANTLGLNRAASFVTAALLIGGFALIAIGAATGNILMVIAGLGLLAAGVYVGVESGALKSWADALGLDSVFGYVTAGMQLAGIALVALGAIKGSLAIVIAGAVILGLGVAGEAIGQERLQAWWDVLKLTTVEQWVSVTLLLVGIVLVCIAAATASLPLLLVGAVILGLGIVASANDDHLQSWVDTLHLNEVAGWVTTAMLLLGIALIAIGAMTLNLPMLLAGAALLGGGIALKASGIGSTKAKSGSGTASQYRAMPSVNSASIPRLATGAVIPPNREFLAVLGDQRQGNNIEAPESAIEAAVARGIAQSGGGNQTVVLQIGEQEFGRLVYKLNNQQTQRVGVKLGGTT